MACNTKKNKYDLIRIVKNKKGEILVDKTGKLNGRGAYICNNIECLEKVIKTNNIFNYIFITLTTLVYLHRFSIHLNDRQI